MLLVVVVFGWSLFSSDQTTFESVKGGRSKHCSSPEVTGLLLLFEEKGTKWLPLETWKALERVREEDFAVVGNRKGMGYLVHVLLLMKAQKKRKAIESTFLGRRPQDKKEVQMSSETKDKVQTALKWLSKSAKQSNELLYVAHITTKFKYVLP